MSLITRFAPSPTGLLHLGHGWSALQAHDLARAAGGTFLLRIEDIDVARCRPAFVDALFDDLHWLGLEWDGPVLLQSQRAPLYQSALEQLIARGLAYRCWCTRAEIAASASAPQGEATPLYPGTCKGRADPGDGRPFCWRLDMERALASLNAPLVWEDAGKGQIAADPARFGDVVIARKDALTSYHIAVTVDDAAQGVSDVVRGMDLFDVTPIHCLLQRLLGLPTPRYHHHALVLDTGGERLAKRRHSPSLAAMREAGADPVQLVDAMRQGRFPIGFGLGQSYSG